MNPHKLYANTPPTKLFIKVAIPSIISMLMSSLYVVVDGAFVGKILGSPALAAVNLVFPLIFINFSIADLIGVGSSVPLAIKLGERDEKSANNIFTCACILNIAAAVVLGLVFFIFAEDFVRLMGADEPLVKLSADYLRVFAAFSPFIAITFAADNYLRICGKVRYSMMVNIFIALGSIVLDFLFLFVMRLDIWSAALAACISMFLGTVLCFIPFLRRETQLRFVRPQMSAKLLGTIFTNGSPTFLNNISGRAAAIIMNVFLLRLGGGVAVAAYGVLMYVDGIIHPVLYGLCDSLQPAIGYNYGAKRHDRVAALAKRIFGVCAVLSIVMTAIILLAGKPVVLIFVQAEDVAVIVMTVHALSLFALGYLTRWVSLASQIFMSAIGKVLYAATISIAMAFVFPVLLMLCLAGSMGLDAMWLNMPLSALLTAILSVILLMKFLKFRAQAKA